jgi:hypothetical protein
MMDLDENLARLARLPVPDLSWINGRRLALRAQGEVRQTRAMLGLGLVVSLGMGVVGGLQVPARAEVPLAAFGPPASLTPLIALGQE